MKKLLVLSIMALLVMSGVSYAQVGDSRVGHVALDSIGLDDSAHVHVSTSPVDVYRVTLTTGAVISTLMLYDSATLGSANNTTVYVDALVADGAVVGDNAAADTALYRNVKAELACGTANETEVFTFDPPLRFEHGLFAGFRSRAGSTTYSGPGDFALIEYKAIQ